MAVVTTPALSFCERVKPSTVTTSAVMDEVGTVLYCVRFVFSLYSDQVVEVKPRSLTKTDLLSNVGESCEKSSFCTLESGCHVAL